MPPPTQAHQAVLGGLQLDGQHGHVDGQHKQAEL